MDGSPCQRGCPSDHRCYAACSRDAILSCTRRVTHSFRQDLGDKCSCTLPPLTLMTALKRRHMDGSRGTSRLDHLHLPSLSLSPCPSQPPQPPSTTALSAANLKEEAIYLASILRTRLSDSANRGDGRGLLSRALARGELDEFLVSFFSDPANLLFAREKVGWRTVCICMFKQHHHSKIRVLML